MITRRALITAAATFCIGLLLGLAVQGKPGSTDVIEASDSSPASQLLPTFTQSFLDPLNHNTAQLVRLDQSIGHLMASVRQCSSPALPASVSNEVMPELGLHVLQQELVQLFQHEFDAMREAMLSAIATAEPPMTDAPMDIPESISPEANRTAFEATYEVVSHALASGRWTDDDVVNLRQHLGALTKAQQTEIFQLLLPAINDGVIAVETTGPIF